MPVETESADHPTAYGVHWSPQPKSILRKASAYKDNVSDVHTRWLKIAEFQDRLKSEREAVTPAKTLEMKWAPQPLSLNEPCRAGDNPRISFPIPEVCIEKPCSSVEVQWVPTQPSGTNKQEHDPIAMYSHQRSLQAQTSTPAKNVTESSPMPNKIQAYEVKGKNETLLFHGHSTHRGDDAPISEHKSRLDVTAKKTSHGCKNATSLKNKQETKPATENSSSCHRQNHKSVHGQSSNRVERCEKYNAKDLSSSQRQGSKFSVEAARTHGQSGSKHQSKIADKAEKSSGRQDRISGTGHHATGKTTTSCDENRNSSRKRSCRYPDRTGRPHKEDQKPHSSQDNGIADKARQSGIVSNGIQSTEQSSSILTSEGNTYEKPQENFGRNAYLKRCDGTGSHPNSRPAERAKRTNQNRKMERLLTHILKSQQKTIKDLCLLLDISYPEGAQKEGERNPEKHYENEANESFDRDYTSTKCPGICHSHDKLAGATSDIVQYFPREQDRKKVTDFLECQLKLIQPEESRNSSLASTTTEEEEQSMTSPSPNMDQHCVTLSSRQDSPATPQKLFGLGTYATAIKSSPRCKKTAIETSIRSPVSVLDLDLCALSKARHQAEHRVRERLAIFLESEFATLTELENSNTDDDDSPRRPAISSLRSAFDIWRSKAKGGFKINQLSLPLKNEELLSLDTDTREMTARQKGPRRAARKTNERSDNSVDDLLPPAIPRRREDAMIFDGGSSASTTYFI